MSMRTGRAMKLATVLTGALTLTATLTGIAAAESSDRHSTDPHSKECRESFADVDNDDGAGCRYKYDKKKAARDYYKLHHDQKDGTDDSIRYDDKGADDTPFEKMVKAFTGG